MTDQTPRVILRTERNSVADRCAGNQCNICATPCPELHIHVWIPGPWRGLRGFEDAEDVRGFCSEECAGRFAAGEPTVDVIRLIDSRIEELRDTLDWLDRPETMRDPRAARLIEGVQALLAQFEAAQP